MENSSMHGRKCPRCRTNVIITPYDVLVPEGLDMFDDSYLINDFGKTAVSLLCKAQCQCLTVKGIQMDLRLYLDEGFFIGDCLVSHIVARQEQQQQLALEQERRELKKEVDELNGKYD